MKKTIRSTYPVELSVGLLILIFFLSFILSSSLFDVPWRELMEGRDTHAGFGMLLISSAVLVMVLILWEEFLFPLKVKHQDGGVVFRNHRNKLNSQLLIYCLIPAIFVFVYLNFEVHKIRFYIWATICIAVPVVVKLVSGLKNYNDFLKLTDKAIEFKNNQKSAVFAIGDIQRIKLMRDQDKVLHKMEVTTHAGSQIIDLDEMELDAFLAAIDRYASEHYRALLG
jgi:hypothetical protein